MTLVGLGRAGRRTSPAARRPAAGREVRRPRHRRGRGLPHLARRPRAVAPTVAALRSHAAEVVDGELARLDQRLPDLDEADARRGAAAPCTGSSRSCCTPRPCGSRSCAGTARAADYAAALRELFDLDPATPPPRRVAAARAGRYAVSAPAAAPATLRLGTRRSALATTQSTWVADLPARARATTVELVEIVTEGDTSTAPLAHRRHRRLRRRPAPGAARRRGRPRRALAQGPARPLPSPASSSPPCPSARTRATCWSPATGCTLGELPARCRRRHRLARAAPPSSRALGLGLVVQGHPRQRRHPHRAGHRRRRSTPSCWPAPAWPGSAALDEVTEVLDPLQMLPAPGQGALAVECRADDDATAPSLAALDDPDTRACVTAERALLAALEAGCSAPVGALAEVVEGEDGLELSLRAVRRRRRRLVRPAPLARRRSVDDAEALGPPARRRAARGRRRPAARSRGAPAGTTDAAGDGPASHVPEAPPPDPAGATGADPLAALDSSTDRIPEHDSTERAL